MAAREKTISIKNGAVEMTNDIYRPIGRTNENKAARLNFEFDAQFLPLINKRVVFKSAGGVLLDPISIETETTETATIYFVEIPADCFDAAGEMEFSVYGDDTDGRVFATKTQRLPVDEALNPTGGTPYATYVSIVSSAISATSASIAQTGLCEAATGQAVEITAEVQGSYEAAEAVRDGAFDLAETGRNELYNNAETARDGLYTIAENGREAQLAGITTHVSKNLYNPALAIDGKYANYDNTNYASNAQFATTGRIPVEPGKTYALSTPNTESDLSYQVRCYNSAGAILGTSFKAGANLLAPGCASTLQYTIGGRKQFSITISPESLVRFIETNIIQYLTHTTADFDRVRNTIQLEQGDYFTSFEPYNTNAQLFVKDVAIPRNLISDILNIKKSDVLYGKVLATAGDSITYGADMDAAGIDAYGELLTYGKLIANRHGMSFFNYGWSGSTMSNVAGKSPFCVNRYQAMSAIIDYLTIWFGVNDNAYGALGTITDTVDTTFYGAWNIVLPWIIQNYPKTKIGLIVPYAVTPEMRQAVRNVGNKWGIPYLDLSGANSPLYYEKDASVGVESSVVTLRRAAFQAVGVHPNSSGHYYLSTIIENFLKTL